MRNKVHSRTAYFLIKKGKSSYLKKPDRHHLNQVNKVTINSKETNKYHLTPDIGEGYNTTYVIILLRKYNLILIMEKQQRHPN